MDLVRNARQGINAVTLDREVEINNIKAALAERYDLILVIFQHYCGAGEIGERYGMSTLEFSHSLRLCGIVVQGNADSYTIEPPRERWRPRRMQRVMTTMMMINKAARRKRVLPFSKRQ